MFLQNELAVGTNGIGIISGLPLGELQLIWCCN